VSKREYDKVVAELAEHDKERDKIVANMRIAMNELQEKLRAKEAEVEELASPEKQLAKEKKEAEKKEVDKELGNMLALMGR
jgi:hypothetical protein